MAAAAIIAGICLLIQILWKFLRYLCRDNNYNQNIWIHGGQSVGEDGPRMDGLLLYGQGNQMNTIVRKRPQERVTSSFSVIYIRLLRESTGECYDSYLEYQLEIGRSSGGSGDSKLQINDPMVSRRHCLLYRKGDQIMIQDLGSTNRTYVNGCLLSGAMPLSHGDQIGFGGSTYQFLCFYQR